jgi:hypothetical protein
MRSSRSTTSLARYDARWRAALAPRTGDIRTELTLEAAEYLGLPVSQVARRIHESATDFPDEWKRMVTNPADPAQLIHFYNESETELVRRPALANLAYYVRDVWMNGRTGDRVVRAVRAVLPRAESAERFGRLGA